MGENVSSKMEVPPAPYDPRILLTSDVLKKAIENDYGSSASLSSFKVVDFTKPGDNYACIVTSVLCEVIIDGQSKTVSYVAKLNPCYALKGFDAIGAEMFAREGSFLVDIAPRLNAILQDLGKPKLRFPHCLYASYEKDKEMLILKDLREKRFGMTDRTKGMDMNHSTLTLEELARLHATGFILKKRLKNKSLLEEFPYAKDSFLEKDSPSEQSMQQLFSSGFDTASEILQDIGGYEKCIQWLNEIKEKALDMYIDQIKCVQKKFETMCHGDAWNNNILFRYDSEGFPEEVSLVDFQMCRVASVATDLNYYLHTSLNGDVRNDNLDKLLSSYYEMLRKVILKEEGIDDVPFTFDELMEEYKAKKLLGVLTGMFLIPMMMTRVEDAFAMSDITDENFEEFMADHKVKQLNQMKTNPLCKLRYLAIFEHQKEHGTL